MYLNYSLDKEFLVDEIDNFIFEFELHVKYTNKDAKEKQSTINSAIINNKTISNDKISVTLNKNGTIYGGNNYSHDVKSNKALTGFDIIDPDTGSTLEKYTISADQLVSINKKYLDNNKYNLKLYYYDTKTSIANIKIPLHR